MTLQTPKVSEVNEHPDPQFRMSAEGLMTQLYNFEGWALISPTYNIARCGITDYSDEPNY